MESVFSSINKFSGFTLLFVFLLSCSSTFTSTEAYDAVDTGGNITIKWDVMSWTPDGYVGVVTIYNFQKHHQIKAPGWRLGWTWAKKEIIWSMVGSQTTEQGDCSRFKGNIPHSCNKDPTVVDLSPKTPFNQQISNCCRGGVLKPWDASSFQLSVGAAGTTNKTVRMPKHFTLNAPGNAYTCGPPQIVQPTKFITQHKKRVTRALMTWIVICKYS
ncbi:hypothetical protein EZV62_024157 [Acer yangbiense]|uniref:COBRA-like protein n=1 Tax=Acer yangbiense TaxID=1000413 RepID=A0A5C7H3Q6_9ROSI|nr:hypothetical protein EZV62_024157 [Acer yangbiense]